MSPVTVPGIHAEVGRRLRAGVRVGALLLAAAWGVAIWVVAGLLIGPDGWTGGSPIPLILDVLLLAGLVSGALWIRRILDRVGEEARISASIEGATGLERGVVQGAIELSRDLPPGVSPALASRMQARTLDRLALPVDRLAGPLGDEVGRLRRRGVVAFSVALPLLLLLAGLAPARATGGLGGLAAPFGVFSGPELPPLVVPGGDLEVVRGGTAELLVEAPLRDRLLFRWRVAGDVPRSDEVEVVDGRATFLFPDVSAEIRWSAIAPDGAETEEHRIVPVDPLFVTDVTVGLQFPAYTGRAREEYRGDLPPFVVPEGTVFDLRGRGSRALRAARLVEEGGASELLEVEGAVFRASWTPASTGEWRWEFEDAEGGSAAAVPQPIRVVVEPDLPPRIRQLAPGPDTLLPLELQMPLEIEAEDDWGLATLELVAWRVDALGEPGPERRQRLELGGAPRLRMRPLLDVRAWELVPGDEVRYWVRVVDTHPSGREARTPESVLRMPPPTLMRREAQMRLEEAMARLELLDSQAERAAEDVLNLERQAQAPERSESASESGRRPERDGSFEEREEVRAALEEQQALISEAQALQEELETLSESLAEAGATDPELEDDLEELQEALEELGGEELQARMEELLQQVGEMDREEAQGALDELAAEQEDFRERLEEALERARRAAMEQELRNTATEAEELAEEQRALAEALRLEDDPTVRAEQQEALSETAAETAERMEALSEELLEAGETETFAAVDEARLSTEAAVEAMQQASEQARAGSEQAGERADAAAQAMQAAAEAMRAAEQGMMEDRASGFEAALRRTTREALALARRQGEVQEAMRGRAPDELAELRGDVAAVRQGLGNLSESLALASRLAGADTREISTRAGAALESLDRTVTVLDSGPGARPSPLAASEQSIAALNEVALSALAALEAMQQGGESSGSSSEQMMEQLQDLAQEQAEVNNQAAQMLPMELPQPQMQQEMQQMAQQQQEIAADLGQMSNQEGEDGPLGDLEAMAQEAEALAEELAGGRLEPEIRRRQERLFHRLLDAGRSLKKEEESTERESEAAGAFEVQGAEALDADALGLLRFGMPDAATLNRLPPAARALVLRYFQRLNGRGGGGGGGR